MLFGPSMNRQYAQYTPNTAPATELPAYYSANNQSDQSISNALVTSQSPSSRIRARSQSNDNRLRLHLNKKSPTNKDSNSDTAKSDQNSAVGKNCSESKSLENSPRKHKIIRQRSRSHINYEEFRKKAAMANQLAEAAGSAKNSGRASPAIKVSNEPRRLSDTGRTLSGQRVTIIISDEQTNKSTTFDLGYIESPMAQVSNRRRSSADDILDERKESKMDRLKRQFAKFVA